MRWLAVGMFRERLDDLSERGTFNGPALRKGKGAIRQRVAPPRSGSQAELDYWGFGTIAKVVATIAAIAAAAGVLRW
jgi:hypothetical protein